MLVTSPLFSKPSAASLKTLHTRQHAYKRPERSDDTPTLLTKTCPYMATCLIAATLHYLSISYLIRESKPGRIFYLGLTFMTWKNEPRGGF